MTEAWTVGNPNSYDQALAKNPEGVAKQVGGWVFYSLGAALCWLDEHNWEYTWEDCVDPVPLHPYRLDLPGSWVECVDPAGRDEAGVFRLKTQALIRGKYLKETR